MRILTFLLSLAFLLILSAGLVALPYFGPFGPGHPYHRFHARTADYYSRLAQACDLVLQQHPNFTRRNTTSAQYPENVLTWRDANGVDWNQTILSGSDPSLPEAIRTLRPQKVLLSPARVFIDFGGGRSAWAIIWGQKELATNQWVLESSSEGMASTVYEVTRIPFSAHDLRR